MMTSLRKKALYSTLILVLLGVIYYQGKNILSTLLDIKIALWPWIILLNIPYIALGGLAFDKLCQPYKIYLRWQDWFGLSFIANFINQLLPYRPGMAIRYFYLHQHYQMKVVQFTLIMIIYFALMIFIGSGFALIGFFLPHLPREYYTTLTLIALIGVACIGFFTVIHWISPRMAQHFKDAAVLFKKQPYALISSFVCLLGMHLVGGALLFLTFTALDTPISMIHCLFLTGLMSLTMIFPVTPGNIGILETIVGSLTQMMYGNFSIGFSAIALFRASQWIPSFILGSYFGYTLMGRIIPRISSIISLGEKGRLD